MYFDINCDLGEGIGNDHLIMPHISSANIACGGHAGNDATMRETVRLAIAHGVQIGAHPSYPDPENFGRISMAIAPEELRRSIAGQIGSLLQITREMGGSLVHVKPHGALYNDASRDRQISGIIADAILEADPALVLVGLSGSVMLAVAAERGLKTAAEVFADRNYTDDGFLVPRSEPDALITGIRESVEHVARMVGQGMVRTRSGRIIPIRADTVCIHGDNPQAAELAKALRVPGPVSQITYAPLGDSAFLIRAGNRMDPVINIRVHDLAGKLRRAEIPGTVSVIPAYADLLVTYDRKKSGWRDFLAAIKEVADYHQQADLTDSANSDDILEIPFFMEARPVPTWMWLPQMPGLPVRR
jgi:5-oxoprolinase (ATP-hydrolysing) subunit A